VIRFDQGCELGGDRRIEGTAAQATLDYGSQSVGEVAAAIRSAQSHYKRRQTMGDSTRRGFVKNSAAGAAGMTVLGAMLTDEAQARAAAHDGPVIAYVHDARTGAIPVLASDREVRVRNCKLAARIASVARRSTH
jgi:hypothetical protein